MLINLRMLPIYRSVLVMIADWWSAHPSTQPAENSSVLGRNIGVNHNATDLLGNYGQQNSQYRRQESQWGWNGEQNQLFAYWTIWRCWINNYYLTELYAFGYLPRVNNDDQRPEGKWSLKYLFYAFSWRPNIWAALLWRVIKKQINSIFVWCRMI